MGQILGQIPSTCPAIINKTWSDTISLEVSENQKIVVDNCLIGVALGPADSDIIKTVISDLPLL
jgi:hypothetical protein